VALVIAKFSEHDAALGTALAGLADRFAYTPIYNALQACKKGTAQAK
jgi:hypothetical protein